MQPSTDNRQPSTVNRLDVFRFLRDISKPGGGLQSAVKRRGGLCYRFML
ncbi:hypothetical protein QUF72_04095 [Desulfobacterales bacterium HSG2]|nr:hypothetical protein [Desulfobacterales bacterium HSG2]